MSRVVTAIRKVAVSPCALHEPLFAGNELEYVGDCIQTGWVSSVGRYVDRLEQGLVEYTGSRFAVATVSGTAALHVALLLAGVRAGDEVLVPALSFVATANAVVNCGAVPHFVDVSEVSLGMDPCLLSDYLKSICDSRDGSCRNQVTGRRIAAIVPMHTFGNPCRINEICEVGYRYNVSVVEDAAESLGSFIEGRHTGTVGRLGILSFNGNKIVTTGGGGAILTSDAELARLAKHITTTGKRPHPWLYEHDVHAYNYRMPNINAALGCAQLERLDDFVDCKRRLAEAYQQAFRQLTEVIVMKEVSDCRSNYWLNAIRLQGCHAESRDAILQATNGAGFMTRPCWTPLNRLPMYQRCPASSLKATDRIFADTVNLPSGCRVGGAGMLGNRE